MAGAAEWYLSSRALQATGMVAEQCHCDLVEALNRMIIRAAALDVDIETLALDIIDRVVRFDA